MPEWELWALQQAQKAGKVLQKPKGEFGCFAACVIRYWGYGEHTMLKLWELLQTGSGNLC
jgi:hypothetical protein